MQGANAIIDVMSVNETHGGCSVIEALPYILNMEKNKETHMKPVTAAYSTTIRCKVSTVWICKSQTAQKGRLVRRHRAKATARALGNWHTPNPDPPLPHNK